MISTALRLLPIALAGALALPLAACQSSDPEPRPRQQAAAQPGSGAPEGQRSTAASMRAGQMIDNLADTAIALLTGPQLGETERLERFRALLRQNFAIPQIGAAILDDDWKTASQPQRQRYLELFEEWIVQTYGTRFREYSGQTIDIAGTYETDRGDRFVQTDVINPAGGEVLRVDWRVRDIAGEDKIIDVMVAGTSMLITQRSEFGAVIDREGGLDGLLRTLEQRLAQAS